MSPIIKAVYYSRFFWNIENQRWNDYNKIEDWAVIQNKLSAEQLELYDWLSGWRKKII